MRTFARLFICFAMLWVARAEIPAGWNTNVMLLAGSSNRPALLFFTASWCGPCRMMARTTLTNVLVQQQLSQFQCLAVDVDEHPDLAEQRDIRAVPAFVLLSRSGEEVARTTGYATADDFQSWLTNGLTEAQTSFERQHQALEKLRTIDSMLASTNLDVSTLVEPLFRMCAERDTALALAAATRLKQVAARNPGAVLEGLNDPQLATRIQVANILRNQLGESFNVDPWADAKDRAQKIEALRRQLPAQFGR